MAQVYLKLPIYQSPNYFYSVSLEGVSYRISFQYNERCERWCMNLMLSDGTPLIMGEAVSVDYPMFIDYRIPDLTGYFFFAPIGKKQNQTISHPYEIWEYYELYYTYFENE